MKLSPESEHPCLQKSCANLDKLQSSPELTASKWSGGISAGIPNFTVQKMGSLCSQLNQSTLSLILLCQFAPPYPAQVFPRAECEMPAASSFPFIPRIAVTLVSQSHAILCLQAAHVPMQCQLMVLKGK